MVYIATTRFAQLSLKGDPASCSLLFSSVALYVTIILNDMQNRKLKQFVKFKQKYHDPTICGLAKDVSAKHSPVFDNIWNII